MPLSLKKFKHGIKWAFMPLIILIFVLILLELIIELINGVICQVHVQVIQIRVIRSLILFCRKSRYALFMYVHTKRIHAV